MMNAHAAWVGVALVASVLAGAQQASPDDLASVQKAYQGGADADSPTYGRTDDGYFNFLLAPKDAAFLAQGEDKSADPAQAARGFLLNHRRAFGIVTHRSDFEIDRIESSDGRSFVRLNQTYDGVPVYGGQISVALTPENDVQSVLSDIMRNTVKFDREPAPTQPAKAAAEAAQTAIAVTGAKQGRSSYRHSAPELVIYDPAVAGQPGEPHLAYVTDVFSEDRLDKAYRVITDAHTNEPLLHFSMVCSILIRSIYDSETRETELPFGDLVRAEGGGPVPDNDDANEVYDFLGDTHDFYLNNHGRDGWDNDDPFTPPLPFGTRAVVRYPEANAFFVSTSILGPITVYGKGLGTDDIVAHEVTHGVTWKESNLEYIFESGAINESLSDIWGEAVDLTNGAGNDDPSVRWLMGEDSAIGAIRNMADPTEFGHPDRYGSYANLPVFIDNGGVHINSGIGNKLFICWSTAGPSTMKMWRP